MYGFKICYFLAPESGQIVAIHSSVKHMIFDHQLKWWIAREKISHH